MTNLHIGGLTTDPQIRRLSERYADIASRRGTVIPHEEIEALIEAERGSNRYKTITNRWRRRVERETGIVIAGTGEAVGVGFRVLTDDEQVGFGVSQRVSAGRRIRRWHSVVSNVNTDRLSPAMRTVRDFEVSAAARLHLAMTQVRKELPSTTMAEQQPRQIPQR